MNPLLSIIVITFKRNNDLNDLLKSISSQNNIDKKLIEIIIVDNNEIDLAKDTVDKYIDELNIIYFSEKFNYSWWKWRNIWVDLAKSDYLLFLDDDNYLQENDILEKIINNDINWTLLKNQEIWSIKYLDEVKEPRTWKYIRTSNYWKINKDIDYLFLNYFSTCWVLVPKKVFYEAGWFDEIINFGLVDNELSVRILKNNHKMILNNKIAIQHNLSTAWRNMLLRERLINRNWLILIYKNYPFIFMIIHILRLIIIQPFLSYKRILFYQNVKFSEFIKQVFLWINDFVKLLFGWKIKRSPMTYKTRFYIKFWVKKENKRIIKQIRF